MKYIPLEIPDVVLIEPDIFGDHRGFFMETYRDNDFKKKVADVSFVQDNHSKSSQGTLRGLHYQIDQTQGKLVRVTSGEVFDVAVDLRRKSPTFGKWVGSILSSENKNMMWVPKGFAHGFYVLSQTAEFTYKCTDYYAPECEKAIKWDDPDIGIKWPLLANSAPSLSAKDESAQTFNMAQVFE